MSYKKFKAFLAIFIITIFIMPQIIFAYSKYIVVGGENIGLSINSKGAIIAGFYKVSGKYPGHDATLNVGDVIIKANDTDINKIDDFINAIKNSDQKSLKLTYKRNNNIFNTTLNLYNENGVIKTGLFIKDTVSGIGTLTFIDPKTKLFGALGHEVIESNSGIMIDVKDGKIYNSSVISIDKSIRGEPGCKNAKTNPNEVFGNIKENTEKGIFGTYTKDIISDKLYEVAKISDIKEKEAKIVTVLNGSTKKEYLINIIKINNSKTDNKNILFEVTDKELIDKTGGIVQGMSGSPIIQDDKIIGAVTNVVVNNPKRGYGVFITKMLEEAEN